MLQIAVLSLSRETSNGFVSNILITNMKVLRSSLKTSSSSISHIHSARYFCSLGIALLIIISMFLFVRFSMIVLLFSIN